MMRAPVGNSAEVEANRPVALDLYGVRAHIIRPLVERAPTAQVEARVVPVAREYPVADTAPVQREAHVRAPVVHRVHPAVFEKQGYRPVRDVYYHASLRPQLLHSSDARESVRYYRHLCSS